MDIIFLKKNSLHSQDFELKSTKFTRTHHIILDTHRLQHSELQLIVMHAGGKHEPTICRPGSVISCNVVLFVTHDHINSAFKGTSDSALTPRLLFRQKVGGIDKKPALTWRTTAQFDAGCPILSALWPARATNRHQLLAKRAVAGSTWSERASTNAPGRVRAEMRRGAPFARQPCMARQVLAGALAAQSGRRGPLPRAARAAGTS